MRVVLMDGQTSIVANLLQGLDDNGEIDPPRFPNRQMMKSHGPPAPCLQVCRALRIEPMILHVNVHDVWCQCLQRRETVRFATQ